MAWYVHLHVCFACNDYTHVAPVARQYLSTVAACREAVWFLEDLSQRTGDQHCGPKGGLHCWGIVGNHTSGDFFVEILKPFWTALLSESIAGAPCPFEHILVFTEAEQSGHALAYEIFLLEEQNPASLTIRKHDCPFAWMQY